MRREASAGVLWALMVVAGAGCASAQQPGPAPGAAPMVPVASVVTSGQGETRVSPDRAAVFIGVETRAATAAQASAENARKQRAVLDTLRALGIAGDQVGTVDFSVYPEMAPQPRPDVAPRVTGYTVRNTVRVEIRKIEQVGSIIDAVIAKGANGINSLQFYASNVDEARRRALAEAVDRARGDAEALARAAGRCVEEPLELSTAQAVRPVFQEMALARRAAADVPTPIEPGEQTLTVHVSARWRLSSQGGTCAR
jgi:uncharacterized protein YggE